MSAHHKQSGFTLLETIIYIGLFSLIFTGIFMSIHPLMIGAERLTKNIAIEGETAFILAKIDYALSHTITDSAGVITTPAAGTVSNELILTKASTEAFHFKLDTTSPSCVTPLICKMLVLSKNSGDEIPLNAQRVQVENLSVKHTASTGGEPRYLDISFTVNGEPVGPVRYYVNF